MRVLISGASGYLGSHLTKLLIANGCYVTCLIRNSSSLDRLSDIKDNIELFNYEKKSISLLFTRKHNFDVIIHTATSYGRNGESTEELIYVNTIFPMNLLRLAYEGGVRFFINTDTALDKNVSSYSLSKSHFCDWAKFILMEKKLSFINLKLEHFYGPCDDKAKFISYVINSCLRNISELKLTNGEQLRDFVFIDDVLSCYEIVLQNLQRFDNGFYDIEIGSGKAHTIRDIVELISKLTNSTTSLIFGAIPYRPNEQMVSRCNNSIITGLGWTPKLDIKSGLTKTIEIEKGFL